MFVNIHTSDTQLQLDAGKYKIDILGGWGIDLGDFSITLKHIESQKVFVCKHVFWPIQSYAFGKKAKRVFSLKLTESGVFTVEFLNPESLVVKESNLLITSRLMQPIDNQKIEAYIHK
jgi:hypothetical protein